MKIKRIVNKMWILISLLFTIHISAQYPIGSEPEITHYIIGYEYGFNQEEALIYTAITPTTHFNLNADIDVSALTSDINVFHIRFLDDSGMWSSMLSHIFIKPPEIENSDKNIIAYEYVFNDSDGLEHVDITPTNDFNLITDIDISNLTSDINVFHIRFLDDSGMWSSMLSHVFIKPPEIENSDKNIIAYEYAFNDGDGLQHVDITPTNDFNLITDIDISNLTSDINVFHIRFLDDSGMWSSMLSHIFIKPPEIENSDKNIIAYEYAFNDGDGLQHVDITPTNDFNLVADIDISNLEHDINVFYIRFLDDSGMWSSMLSHLFINPPQPTILTDNKIISYEYWFDHNEANKVSVDINPDEENVLVQELDMTNIWRGEHKIHSQYKDSYGKYSLVMTDTIVKTPYPIAVFEVNNSTACVGETVQFTDIGSIDYDTVTYNFDDGNTSTDINTSHIFDNSGTYNVSLTVVDTETGLSAVFEQMVTVQENPLNTVTLETFPLLLTANQTNATYQWIDCTNENTPIPNATSNTYEPLENGAYAVEVSLNGCMVTSDCIVVNTVSVADNELSKLVKLFPNPTKEYLTIQTEVPIRIQFYNINGKKIMEFNIDIGNQVILVNSLSNGLYFAKVTVLSGNKKDYQGVYKVIKN